MRDERKCAPNGSNDNCRNDGSGNYRIDAKRDEMRLKNAIDGKGFQMMAMARLIKRDLIVASRAQTGVLKMGIELKGTIPHEQPIFCLFTDTRACPVFSEYRGKKFYELPPHVFALADDTHTQV